MTQGTMYFFGVGLFHFGTVHLKKAQYTSLLLLASFVALKCTQTPKYFPQRFMYDTIHYIVKGKQNLLTYIVTKLNNHLV